MKVILRDDVANIGKKGGAYEVSSGYFRNYLQPRGLAVMATSGGVKVEQIKVKQASTKEGRELDKLKVLAGELGELTLTFPVKVGEQGRMYGSVTAKDVADELNKVKKLDIDRHKLDLGEGLRSVGEHTVSVKLDHGVEATVKVELVPESSGA